MFAQKAVSALNHLLSGETWARERLRRFAGQHARLVAGPVKLDLAVDGEGYFNAVSHPDEAPSAVTIELPADAPFLFLVDRNSVFSAARLSGTADFAEALAFVFRNLRWDVEEDLSKLVGDIAAHRLVWAGKAFFGWQAKASRNLATNAAEYLSEETDLLVHRRAMERFCAEIDAVEKDLARLESRVVRLR